MSSVKHARHFNARAAELIGVYEGTYGSSGPYCCPQAVANVIEKIARDWLDAGFHEAAAAELLHEARNLVGFEVKPE